MKGGGAEDGQSPRVEELLRVNAELAAEIRSLTLGRTHSPRSARTPAARRMARLIADRDETAAKLAAAEQEIVGLERHNSELIERHDELRDLVERQVLELERLRGGPLGVLRSAQARILRRRSKRGGGA